MPSEEPVSAEARMGQLGFSIRTSGWRNCREGRSARSNRSASAMGEPSRRDRGGGADVRDAILRRARSQRRSSPPSAYRLLGSAHRSSRPQRASVLPSLPLARHRPAEPTLKTHNAAQKSDPNRAESDVTVIRAPAKSAVESIAFVNRCG